MKKIFIGIDVSKDWIDYACCEMPEHKMSTPLRVDNEPDSIAQMCKRLLKKYGQENLYFCFEHTGSYGLLLGCTLEELHLTYTVIPALEAQLSIGIKRGKNDKVDASRLAEYAASNSHKLKPSKMPSEALLQIKELLTYRTQLVKISVQLQNSLKAHQISSAVSKLKSVVMDIEQRLEELHVKIKAIELEIKGLIDSQPELQKNFGLVSSVKGIGLMIAAYMLVTTSNFTSFDNPRKFNCYSGLAPFEHTSGSSIHGKTQTSHLANKTMKTLLYSGAISAAHSDPQLKKYYNRKKLEGKAHKSIINAIACKLISRAFAVVKRQSEFVLLTN